MILRAQRGEALSENHRIAWHEVHWSPVLRTQVDETFVEDFDTEAEARAWLDKLSNRVGVLEVHHYTFDILRREEDSDGTRTEAA